MKERRHSKWNQLIPVLLCLPSQFWPLARVASQASLTIYAFPIRAGGVVSVVLPVVLSSCSLIIVKTDVFLLQLMHSHNQCVLCVCVFFPSTWRYFRKSVHVNGLAARTRNLSSSEISRRSKFTIQVLASLCSIFTWKWKFQWPVVSVIWLSGNVFKSNTIAKNSIVLRNDSAANGGRIRSRLGASSSGWTGRARRGLRIKAICSRVYGSEWKHRIKGGSRQQTKRSTGFNDETIVFDRCAAIICSCKETQCSGIHTK